MIWHISHNLGYDDWGNNDKLLLPADKELIEAGKYTRASLNAACSKCGFTYYHHPQVQGALWLRRTCEGILVKL